MAEGRTAINQLTTNRLETFSDAVMAVIITIAVLNIRAPQGADISSLFSLLPIFGVYAVSFQTIATYWNNHHHLLHATKKNTSGIMWTNMLLLFWLSLIPFATEWLGNNFWQMWPTAFFASILLLSALSYFLLQHAIIKAHGDGSAISNVLNSSFKDTYSFIGYAIAIGVAFFAPWLSYAIILFLAALWFLPDKRLESKEVLAEAEPEAIA